MVAEPCASPYSGACHVGSRDPFERLDSATPIVFQQSDLEDSSTLARIHRCFEDGHVVDEEDEMFVISEGDME